MHINQFTVDKTLFGMYFKYPWGSLGFPGVPWGSLGLKDVPVEHTTSRFVAHNNSYMTQKPLVFEQQR